MKKLDAIKDGEGNIIISEDSFEFLLACLDNQKFVGELPKNGDSIAEGEESYNATQLAIQNSIDEYNKECRKILHQNYVFTTESDGYFLVKKYKHQDNITPWSGKDVGKIYEIFKDTKRIYQKEIEEKGTLSLFEDDKEKSVGPPENEPWYFERPLRYDGDYLTVSEVYPNNRPWTEEEIKKIQFHFNHQNF